MKVKSKKNPLLPHRFDPFCAVCVRARPCLQFVSVRGYHLQPGWMSFWRSVRRVKGRHILQDICPWCYGTLKKYICGKSACCSGGGKKKVVGRPVVFVTYCITNHLIWCSRSFWTQIILNNIWDCVKTCSHSCIFLGGTVIYRTISQRTCDFCCLT